MEVGEVVVVKNSGERVTVIEPDIDGKVMVRRPLAARDGITHVTEGFFPCELETVFANIDRQYAEGKYIAKLGNPTAPEPSNLTLN